MGSYLHHLDSQWYATRARARQIRQTVQQAVAGGGPDADVVFDADGVQSMTWGFADELICQLALAGRKVTVLYPNQDVAETIELAVSRHPGLADMVRCEGTTSD